ncbi:transglutaminase domain-containing protein [Enterococcus sp. CWB-B31]|uniref:transglutaminase domain-containing protein n=1 Tax=Enterococcus sp. CWB-B31 TaxID=2885159 RepID=UPI001E502B91|nr:transglutaminase-like domain-containing protein [Enterococcus sp. CWB-B31]MCB5955772.1 transglutaminase-like domain-containing protein [Enterococcus sp. CWB-B31]
MKNKIFVVLAGITLILGGCQGTKRAAEKDESAGNEISSTKLALDIKNKYDEAYIYSEERLMVERDEPLKIEIGFDPEELGMKNYTEVVEVFQDPELTQSLGTGFEMDEERTQIEVLPPKTAPASISSSDLDKNSYGYDSAEYTLFDKGEYGDWGNLQQYYMIVRVDLDTGEKLEKPIVTLFSVIHEIPDSLRLKMKINEEGMPEYSWNEVEDAEYYYILDLDYTEKNGYRWSGSVRAQTEETTWTPENVAYLRTYSVSEYERRKDYNIEKYGEGDEPIYKDQTYQSNYAVIAVSKDGTSAISNAMDIASMAERIPSNEEIDLSNEEEGKLRADSYSQLPSYRWVTMCDGSLVQKLVTYEVSKAKVATESIYSYEKEDMSDMTAEKVEVVVIPYTIDGTGFSGKARVETFKQKTLEDNLSALETRQNLLRSRAGTTEMEVVPEAEAETEDEKESSDSIQETTDKITANSALSEYLAIHMISGKTTIDLKDFPEARDQTYLADAWMEAIYQNPLILGAEGASISDDGMKIMIRYNMDTSAMKKQQKELRAEVKKVVKEIITDKMSDLEKEYAINQYLCEIAEYDNAALENAEENDFVTVDEAFNDSFTPYGVLINKVGVCASYASAFKLLADEAGLETIVVTGYLDGDLPHAWNKVKVNGEWNVLDSTNNDNELLNNVLLNVSGKASKRVLVEDSLYVLDKNLLDYEITEDVADKEFYHVEEKFFDEDKISDKLVDSLEKEGLAVLRTSYDLDDQRFAVIAEKVLSKTKNEELQGFYWMGVIYMDDGSHSFE